MEYPSRIPSQLRPFEIKGLTVSEYPVTEDNGEYYIEVDIESRGSMFVTFYDENGNKLDDVNYKLSEDKITIYIGEPAYNRLDLVIFSNGQYFDQLDIWAQNPENHMELFSLDLYDIPKKTDPDYETKMAVLNEYRLAVGRKSAPTYNMTIQEILRYFEQEGIFPLFLRVDGYLRNVAGFDNSSARSNLEILSKEEIWGRWDSDNEYANPTGLMYNQNLFNGGGDGTDGRLPNSDAELLRDNNASLHLYGLNQNMPDKARRIEMNNVVAVKGEWNKYVWPYLDYSEYKIKKFTPSTSMTPVFKDGYYRKDGYATPFLEKDRSDPEYGNIAMFNRNDLYTNNILFQKKYWNNTQNTGAGHNMDDRSNWYMSIVVNLHFAVPKNFPVPAVLNFEATGQVKQYLDSLLSSTSQKYNIGSDYTVLTGQRFRTHYKGKCYDGPENAYKKNEDSNTLTYYGYDSYNNPVSGTREPQSLFNFESYTNFYPFGSYNGDLYPGTDSDSKKYVPSVFVGNNDSGWNARNVDVGAYTIIPDSNTNIWHNRSVAYLAYNRNVGKYCIMLFMQPEINKEDNINDWGNNEWWIEGDSMLM